TPAREIVRSLRRAGLRRRGGVEPWRWTVLVSLSSATASRVVNDVLPSSDLPVDRLVAEIETLGAPAELRVGERAGERLLVAAADARRDLAVGFERLTPAVALHRSVGERGSYVEVSIVDTTE